jgi:hypothetical protein
MSSVDLHTQYGYQVMIPEAIAIVMAPSKKKDSGIFSITLHGMHVLEVRKHFRFHLIEFFSRHVQSVDFISITKTKEFTVKLSMPFLILIVHQFKFLI